MALLDETATVDLSKLYFGEPTKLKNGQMVIPVSLEAGKFGWDNRLEFQFGTQKQMVHSQYGLNKPQERADPNRRNLDFTPTPEMEKHLRACDAAVVKYCSENCETLFKTKTLNKQFCPIVQDKDKGTIVRVKVVSGGEGQLTEIRCFTPDCKGIFPGDINHLTRNLDLIVITSSLGVWYNSSQFGISLKAESILAKPSALRRDVPPGAHRQRVTSCVLPQVGPLAHAAVCVQRPVMRHAHSASVTLARAEICFDGSRASALIPVQILRPSPG